MYRLLAVFAHPDDETFRPGGTLALLAAHGVRVQVLTATHGELGSCGDPPLCEPGELGGWRANELCCACTALSLEPPRLLDYPDGGLSKVDPARLIAEILSVVRPVQPQVMLSFGPDGLSGHPDHIAIGYAARKAFSLAPEVAALYTLAVPQSLAQKLEMHQIHSVPDTAIALSVDIASVWEIKLAAMHCHATQLSETPLLHAPKEKQQLFFGREFFVKADERSTDKNFFPGIMKDYLL